MKQKYIKLIIIIFIFLLIGSIIIKPKKEIELKKQDESNITFAYVWGSETKSEAPSKESGYTFDTTNSSCTNGTEIYWDTLEWGAKIKKLGPTKTKCTLKFNQIYKEDLLKGTDPVLGTGMIPITIDNDGKVHKADISTEWYSYQNKQWANAVILVDETKDYKNGEEIPEGNIESYFVWIPRYKYKLKENESVFNGYKSTTDAGTVDNVGIFYQQHPNKATNNAFEITFETKDKPIESGITAGSFVTHPAFTAFDSNGFWAGKFETGYNQNADTNKEITTNGWTTAEAEKNIQNSEKVIIKPNVYSWRNINVSNAFYTSYEYKRELESHMMKNTEWGAVAYLTQSEYGRCTNGSCEEVRINNSGSHITGMSAKSDPTCGFTDTNENCNHYETTGLSKDGETINNYNNQESVSSSTTGNYYGVFDMSGGAWEYVMGVIQSTDADTSAPASGRNSSLNSNFKGPYSCPICDNQTEKENTTGKSWPSKKYYDLYDYKTTNVEYQRGILGDATKEVGTFYGVYYQKTKSDGTKESGPVRYVSSYNADLAGFVHYGYPWFRRGGSRFDGTDAGVFAFSSGVGSADTLYTFRIILTP